MRMNWTRRDFVYAALVIPACGSIAARPPRRIRTVAGTGSADREPGIAGAVQTPVTYPYGITAGPDGALYFCEVDSYLAEEAASL